MFVNYPTLKDQLTLGMLIEKLARCKPDSIVYFDFGNVRPINDVDSYRGFYEQLALGYEDTYSISTVTVRQLLKTLEDSVLATFGGWKGGEYVMDDDTPMWAANRGDSTRTMIVGVHEYEYGIVYLLTARDLSY